MWKSEFSHQPLKHKCPFVTTTQTLATPPSLSAECSASCVKTQIRLMMMSSLQTRGQYRLMEIIYILYLLLFLQISHYMLSLLNPYSIFLSTIVVEKLFSVFTLKALLHQTRCLTFPIYFFANCTAQIYDSQFLLSFTVYHKRNYMRTVSSTAA